MNGTFIWLVSLIHRIANGEKLERASRAEWRFGISVVTGFLLFAGPFALLMEAVNPVGTLATWALVTALFSVGFFLWFVTIRKLRLPVLLFLLVVGWGFVAFITWR